MHRLDLAEATGQPFNPDADHDGRIIADLVAEWATTHDLPFDLELTGPAGGHYTQGTAGEHVTIDAIEFARTLAERAHGEGVLSHPLHSDTTATRPTQQAMTPRQPLTTTVTAANDRVSRPRQLSRTGSSRLRTSRRARNRAHIVRPAVL
jgi:hypothetical protein